MAISSLSHLIEYFFREFVQVLRHTLLQNAAFGAGEDGHQLAFFSKELLLKIPKHNAVPNLFGGGGRAHMLIQDHGVVPIETAQAVGSVGIDAHLIEHIGTDLHFPGSAAQQTDAFVKFYLHIVEFGPIFNGSFHIDAVGDIAEGAVKVFLLLRGQNITVDFNVHFAFAFVVKEKGNVIHEFFVVHLVVPSGFGE